MVSQWQVTLEMSLILTLINKVNKINILFNITDLPRMQSKNGKAGLVSLVLVPTTDRVLETCAALSIHY